MYIYIINYILIPFWSCIKDNRIIVVFSGLQLFLILAFRSESLGVDVENYSWMFTTFSAYPLSNILCILNPFSNNYLTYGIESGYVLFNWIIGNLGFSFHSFLVIHSAICIFSICFFIYKYSKIYWLSFSIIVAIGLYGSLFCILRQSLAASILFFAIPFIKKHCLFRALLIIFLATQFHASAWLFLPLYWLSHIQIDSKKIIVVFLSSVLFCLFMSSFGNSILPIILKIFSKHYTLNLSFAYNNMFLFMIVMDIFIFFFYRNEIAFNENERIIFWIVLWAVPIQAIGFFFPIISRASTGIFLPLCSVTIANLIARKEDNNQVYFFSFLCYMLFFIYYVIFFIKETSLAIIPYRFFFD